MVETFDILAYLDDTGIDYAESGKNVTRGWVNMQCPFCGDHSNHLGINLDSKIFHCWICGEKGPVTKLIRALNEHISYNEVNNILSKYQDKMQLTRGESGGEPIQRRCKLPKSAKNEWNEYHYNYLVKRRFNPHKLRKDYHLKFCYNLGTYKFRIIVPVIMRNRIVNFTAIDTVNSGQAKYKHCPNDLAAIPIRGCLYNIDSVAGTAIIVEGVTDAWRIGPGAVATFGIEFTKEQINRIMESGITNIFVMYDGEPQATKKAEELSTRLDTLPGIKHVEVLTLPKGDPADLSEEDVKEIRKEFLGA